jgi:hypothetical protein
VKATKQLQTTNIKNVFSQENPKRGLINESASNSVAQTEEKGIYDSDTKN